jgi:hypothetical protein
MIREGFEPDFLDADQGNAFAKFNYRNGLKNDESISKNRNGAP